MAELKQDRILCVSLLANAVRNERINIGFVVLEQGIECSGFADVRCNDRLAGRALMLRS